MREPEDSYSIAAARHDLPSLVREAEAGAAIEITRHGKPVAVLISTAEYASLTGSREALWPALEAFRESTDLEELDIESVYRDTRDRSPGRVVDL